MMTYPGPAWKIVFVVALIGPVIGGLLMSAVAADRLDVPARASDLIASRLLLDIGQAGERIVAVGERGHVIYSNDDGENWHQAEVPVGVTLTAVDFPSAETGYAVGHDGVILASHDGGKSWQRQTDGREIFPAVIEAAEAELEAARLVLDKVPTSEDAQFALEDAEFALDTARSSIEFGPSWPLLDVWFADERRGWTVGAYGLLLGTEDGGENWQLRSDRLDNPEDLSLNAIYARHHDVLLLLGEQGVVFRSLDSGETFERQDTAAAGSLYGAASLGSDDVVAFGFGDRVLVSSDDGETFKTVVLPASAILLGAVDFGGRVGLLGAGGAMLHLGPGLDPGFDRPGGTRDFLSGGLVTNLGTMVLTGERGILRIEPDDG